MALKTSRNLFSNLLTKQVKYIRHVSQYYPIDEHIFGLSSEQIQVTV